MVGNCRQAAISAENEAVARQVREDDVHTALNACIYAIDTYFNSVGTERHNAEEWLLKAFAANQTQEGEA